MGISTVITPDVIIGLLVTVRLLLSTPILVTVPPPPPPLPVALITKSPVLPGPPNEEEMITLVPAVMLVTPELVIW